MQNPKIFQSARCPSGSQLQKLLDCEKKEIVEFRDRENCQKKKKNFDHQIYKIVNREFDPYPSQGRNFFPLRKRSKNVLYTVKTTSCFHGNNTKLKL